MKPVIPCLRLLCRDHDGTFFFIVGNPKSPTPEPVNMNDLRMYNHGCRLAFMHSAKFQMSKGIG